jgi:superfamily I DNA/RNA helicase
MKENTVKVLTIHTAKGLEANNVIVIGTRWNDAEERRINYVAATRARDLLVWTRTPSRRKKPATTYWGG